ncbi:hypothetical protein [Cryptosporidium parvum Iowa II]|uniref:Uncharacterized protein n=2 Tax=Cryptosporidium parvum TaxID=5807 RepID=Q5CSX7_CRYPI|nr:hypothetical protein [Cryptosporidium parvum Iowa II]EAK88485.1 hypothetical protein cgd1_940 [Cryptosporidium parvum Iowa II]QOY43533.1 Uncharacterized protein CPATCC_0038410 [Cryptosporidium parvum]WKS75993.1 hypothetical protein CPCDC_1g940 [Cryptosporidium sp. 43IA8]WRK30487.1 Uncharacterized protein cpbgf_100940 [Cryptosporidium parvum]|eukprot:QOY43533.1 hypothetical protein CPATCC_000327 [Cryptosporidium parvum]
MDNDRSISMSYIDLGSDSPTSKESCPSNLEYIIELVIYSQLVISLFLCIGRTDYNFTLYLLGYGVFCVEMPPLDVNGLIRKITGIRRFLMLIILATAIEAIWLSFAVSAWLCPNNQNPDVCFVEDFQMNWEYKLHQYIIWGSSINFILKLVLGTLCWMWIDKERTKLEAISLKPLIFFW